MKRPITGFRQDDEGHWVALLSCGHPQHVRHHPPMASRPWVLTEEGRRTRLGLTLDCVRCDRAEWPQGFVACKRTPTFTETTTPPGLRKDHATRAGVWARIVVEQGLLRYVVPALGLDETLSPGRDGTVVAEVLHHVEPLGPVRFYVEFHRREGREA